MNHTFVLIGMLILLPLGGYEYLKIFIIKKRYSKENIKIVFTISIGRLIGNLCGMCFGLLCIFLGTIYLESPLPLLGAVCFSASSSDFCHSYLGVTEKGVVMDGRLIGYDDVKKYGSAHGMGGAFYFLSIFEVYTPEYREYVYVKKDCDVISEILG